MPELHDRDSGATLHVDLSSQQHQGDQDLHSSDAAHLCHCLHAHVGGLPSHPAVTPMTDASGLIAALTKRVPRSAPPRTLLRPPIS